MILCNLTCQILAEDGTEEMRARLEGKPRGVHANVLESNLIGFQAPQNGGKEELTVLRKVTKRY